MYVHKYSHCSFSVDNIDEQLSVLGCPEYKVRIVISPLTLNHPILKGTGNSFSVQFSQILIFMLQFLIMQCLDLLCESKCMLAIITNHNIDIIIRETHSMSSSEAHYVHSVLSHDLPLQSRPTLPFGFMSPIETSTPTFHGLMLIYVHPMRLTIMIIL